jgi:phage shock protein PspC (stress-responsive transcriptional regulator)
VFEQSKSFPKLVGLSALLIAGSAAFFSVFGLSKLFAGATFAVIIMASSLEFGKLVAASFLYRYWDKINFLQKFYMSLATVILILITSAGIFGFLSNAYQGATVEFEKESTALIFKEDRLEQLEEDKMFLKEELEQAIEELPDNYRTARRKLREDYQPQISEINKQMIELKGEIGTLKTALVQTGVDVGPVIYLARTFDTDVDTVVKFFIFVLIFVFDPMAVMFVISYNVALQHTPKNKKTLSGTEKKKKWEVYGENKKEKPIELKPDSKDLPNIENKKENIGRGGISGKNK